MAYDAPYVNSDGRVDPGSVWPDGTSVCNCVDCLADRATFNGVSRFHDEWHRRYEGLVAQGAVDAGGRGERYRDVGVEFISPILRGTDGLDQIQQVLDLINDAGGILNDSCGMHVHIGVSSVTDLGWDQSGMWLANLLYQSAAHEQALLGANAGRMRAGGRDYARPIKEENSVKDAANVLLFAETAGQASTLLSPSAKARLKETALNSLTSGDRRFAVNCTSLGGYGTVEFRLFNGTVDSLTAISRVHMALALAEKSLASRRPAWESEATRQSYKFDGPHRRAMERFFYSVGWSAGRYGGNNRRCAGWLLGTGGELDETKAFLRDCAARTDDAMPRRRRRRSVEEYSPSYQSNNGITSESENFRVTWSTINDAAR
jgi:hypothetical protein